jgi:hypothetical protein
LKKQKYLPFGPVSHKNLKKWVNTTCSFNSSFFTLSYHTAADFGLRETRESFWSHQIRLVCIQSDDDFTSSISLLFCFLGRSNFVKY